MNFTELDFSEYKKIRLELLRSVEGFNEESYADKNGYATIGIGINIEADKTDKIWLKIVLYYLFGLLKDENEIDFAQFDSYQYTFKNIIKDTKSYKYNEYKTLIDKIATNTKGLKSSHLNQSIETEIKTYIKETTKDNRATRLTESDLKITKDANNKPNYIKFKLEKEKAEALFNIIIINYEATTLRLLNDKGIVDFNKIKEKDKSNRKYYKEFIPFVSATYQSPNIIKDNTNISIIKKAFEFESRFFFWAILRYKLGSDIRRRILQSAIFNFNNKKDKELETDIEKFNTCISIFKTLNLLNESNKKQTYLKYFEGIDSGIDDTITSETNAYNIRISQKYKTDSNYAIYRSTYINPNELQSLKDILNPYAQYLDNLIPQAHFENNADFTRFTLESTNNKSNKPTNTDSAQTKQYRFKLNNIYFIDNTNYKAVIEALQFRASQCKSNSNDSNSSANSKDSTDSKQNILIIITDKLNEPICLKKPKDCYLYAVCAKGNELDCSFCNDICLDSTPQYDECELYCYELEANKPKITPLHSNDEIELLQDSKERFSGKQDNFEYNIDKHNCLCIMRNDEIIMRLANYRFYITQDSDKA